MSKAKKKLVQYNQLRAEKSIPLTVEREHPLCIDAEGPLGELYFEIYVEPTINDLQNPPGPYIKIWTSLDGKPRSFLRLIDLKEEQMMKRLGD